MLAPRASGAREGDGWRESKRRWIGWRSTRSFRDALHRDPRAALDGYDLSADDLERLAGQLMTDVEPKSGRPSKAALLDLLRDRAGN